MSKMNLSIYMRRGYDELYAFKAAEKQSQFMFFRREHGARRGKMNFIYILILRGLGALGG